MPIVIKKKAGAPKPEPLIPEAKAPKAKHQPKHLLDRVCLKLIAKNRNLLVPWIMMASYAYYIADTPIISDGCYDSLCRDLFRHYDQVTHRHKSFIQRESLKAGSVFHLKAEDYPSIVRSAAHRLMQAASSGRADDLL